MVMTFSDQECRTIENALVLANEQFNRYADDSNLPTRIRQQFEKQARETSMLADQIQRTLDI